MNYLNSERKFRNEHSNNDKSGNKPMNHSNSYGDLGLLSVTTDLKLVGCVIDNSLRILGITLYSFMKCVYKITNTVLKPSYISIIQMDIVCIIDA